MYMRKLHLPKIEPTILFVAHLILGMHHIWLGKADTGHAANLEMSKGARTR
jgi:hypothetical protein